MEILGMFVPCTCLQNIYIHIKLQKKVIYVQIYFNVKEKEKKKQIQETQEERKLSVLALISLSIFARFAQILRKTITMFIIKCFQHFYLHRYNSSGDLLSKKSTFRFLFNLKQMAGLLNHWLIKYSKRHTKRFFLRTSLRIRNLFCKLLMNFFYFCRIQSTFTSQVRRRIGSLFK